MNAFTRLKKANSTPHNTDLVLAPKFLEIDSVKQLTHLASSNVLDHRLNMELDLQKVFLGFMCTAVVIG
jgi:hypothetical protein